jgi:tetratricopeptide (TPR) repeat protein
MLMAKVVKFQAPVPEKFGPQRVRKKKNAVVEKPAQLDLFSGGKVVRLHQLTFFEEALQLDDRGDRQQAVACYFKAIEAGDSVADAYCNVGILESQQSNYAKAIDCFTRCLQHEPRHYEAHYNLANLYAEVGNFGLAKVHYETAIEIEPSFTNSYFNLGLTLAMSKEFKEAVRVLTQYRQLTPGEEHQHTDELIKKLQMTF